MASPFTYTITFVKLWDFPSLRILVNNFIWFFVCYILNWRSSLTLHKEETLLHQHAHLSCHNLHWQMPKMQNMKIDGTYSCQGGKTKEKQRILEAWNIWRNIGWLSITFKYSTSMVRLSIFSASRSEFEGSVIIGQASSIASWTTWQFTFIDKQHIFFINL